MAPTDREMEEALGPEGWERCRAACPGVEVPRAAFARYLGERLPADLDAAAALARASTADLYLACGCALGQPQALALCEERYLARVPAYLAGLAPSPTLVDEVRQVLRTRLFVAGGEARPKICEYSGSGPLGGWLRIAAVRTALTLLQDPQARREGRGEEALDQLPGRGEGVEADYLKARYRGELAAAFREGLRSLSAEPRDLLRLHYLEGLTVEQVAARVGISRATATRGLAAAKAALLRETRRLLQERLNIGEAEAASLIGLLRSQLGASIVSGLRAP